MWLPTLYRTGGHGGEVWRLGVQRLVAVPASLVGMGPSDLVATLLGAALLLGAGCLLGPPKSLPRMIPLLGVLVGYLILPLQLRSVGFVYPRLVAFLVPAAMLAFRPRQGGAPFFVAAGLVPGSWLALFALRLAAFQSESASFRALLDDLAPGRAVRPLIFERESEVFPGVGAYLHYSAYYHVEKGGTQGFAFARYPTSVVRERAPGPRVMADGAEWNPSTFDSAREVPHFDYFMVRSKRDRAFELFARGPDVRLVSRHGDWWAYEALPLRSAASNSLETDAGEHR
jgi:hypothetical protein